MINWNDYIMEIEDILHDVKHYAEDDCFKVDKDYELYYKIIDYLENAIVMINTLIKDMEENYPKWAEKYYEEE